MSATLMTGTEGHATSAGSIPSEFLSILTQPRRAWLLSLFGGVLWRGFTHLGTHRKVLRFLLQFPPLTEVISANPSFAIRYLRRDYLAKGFSVAERAACFLCHYKRLTAAWPDRLMRHTLQEDVTIYRIPEGSNRFTLTMGLCRRYLEEGELAIHLRVDDEIAFVLCFTIVPGWVVNSQAAEVLLITQIQGVKGSYSQISAATRALHDVAPNALLLAALQGVADALGIGEIAAVSATRQSSYREGYAAAFLKNYDIFFAESGMSKSAAGFYRTPVPRQVKPLASIKQGHKLRTKEKRAFKLQVELACAAFFESFASSASPGL